MAEETSSLQVNVFDGTRQPMGAGVPILITITDGSNRQLVRDYCRTGQTFALPFYNNLFDDYTVVAYADGYTQAGFTPVKCSSRTPQTVDIILLKSDASFNFAMAQWDGLVASHPLLHGILAHGAPGASAARDRYEQLMETEGPVLACLLNITTAMMAVNLPAGNPLAYFKEFIWDDTMAQDRFYGYADPALYNQVKLAQTQGTFARVSGFAVFHKGATDSFKQIQFGEANVQLTFHADDKKVIDGLECIKMEPDIDYYKDLAAHVLLEVIHNGVGGCLTDPKQVYVLRWIAGRRAGFPEFDPPYLIV